MWEEPPSGLLQDKHCHPEPSVRLKVAKKGTLAKAIQAAWRNTAAKRLLKPWLPALSLRSPVA
jgi:hypothetical protein